MGSHALRGLLVGSLVTWLWVLSVQDTAKADRTTLVSATTAQVLQARDRARSANNLKQIGLAMHNYHAVHNVFPGNLTSKDGKPLLSWRVAILPYLEQEKVYQQFKMDEPWDSEHNKKLLASMPAVYAPVGGEVKEKYVTFYQGFVGKGTVFEEKQKITIASITDGTSNTIMVVEAGEPVPWSKPEDLPYDAKKDLPKLGGMFAGDFHILLCDGSVRYIRKGFDPAVLRLAITRNDGQVFDLDKLR
jgi:hypothetical protein